MKLLSTVLAVPALLGMLSCNKVNVESPDDFNVALQGTTFSVNDSVRFTLQGNPDNILFYSGEKGFEYEKRNVFTADGGIPQMQFIGNVNFGDLSIANRNLSVLVSTDFNGNYNAAGVQSATWTDITSRAILPAAVNTNTASGIINLSDLKVDQKPIYVAFRYVSQSPATLKQRQWTISGFQFNTQFPDGRTFANANSMYTGGFGTVDLAGAADTWTRPTSVTSTNIQKKGLDPGVEADDDWSITKAFDISKANRSTGEVLKHISYLTPPAYAYKYAAPGTYKVVFVAQNSIKGTTKEVVREFNITVTP